MLTKMSLLQLQKQKNANKEAEKSSAEKCKQNGGYLDCNPEKDNDNLCGSHLQSGSASQLKIQKP